jgi:hypothetical protein
MLSTWRETTINPECFLRLLEVSPNLQHLKVTHEVLQSLLNNESIRPLLKQSITQIYISVSLSTSLASVISSISQLTSTFSSMKHFYFFLEKGYESSELLILAILNSLPDWNSLVTFGVVNAVIPEEISSKDIQQWVMDNSILNEDVPFAVDYTNKIFRLWL